MNKKYVHIVTNINFGEFVCSLNAEQQKKLYSTSPLDIYGLFATDSKMFSCLSLIKNVGDTESEVIEVLKNGVYKSDKIIEVVDRHTPRATHIDIEFTHREILDRAMLSLISKFSTFEFFEEESHLCYLRFSGPEEMRLSKQILERDRDNGTSIVQRHRFEIIKMIKKIMSMGLKECKELVDNALDGDPQWATFEIPMELTKTEIYSLIKIINTEKWIAPYYFDGVDVIRNKIINQIVE